MRHGAASIPSKLLVPARCSPIVLATLDCVFGAAVFVYACAQTLIDRHFALTYFFSSPESVPFDYPLLHEYDEAYCVKLLSRSSQSPCAQHDTRWPTKSRCAGTNIAERPNRTRTTHSCLDALLESAEALARSSQQ